MLRLPGLHQSLAEPAGAAGAARHLLKNLERPLRRARIAVREADIGIDHADEREQRKIMPFGDKLRADDDVARTISDGVEFVAQSRRAAGKIRRQDQRLRLRPERRDFFREALDTGAARRQRIDIVAFGAMLRHTLDMAALMADEGAAEAVLDEPGCAIRTLEAMPAGAAERQRRIAAPVEKEQRLLAGGKRLADGGGQRRRKPFSARRRHAPQIDRFDRRQFGAAETRGEPQVFVAALLGIDARFDRRRRRSEDHRGLVDLATHHRHIARMIGDAIILLIGRLVLLIDDKHGEVAER